MKDDFVPTDYLCTIVQESGDSIQLRRERGELRLLTKEAPNAKHAAPEFAEIRLDAHDMRMLRDALNEALGEGNKV